MVTDIMLDEDNDLIIKDGDLVLGDSRYQHVKHLFEAEKGFYKFNPTSGVGTTALINDELAPEEVIRLLRSEVEKDGFKVSKLLINNVGKIEIDGDYENA